MSITKLQIDRHGTKVETVFNEADTNDDRKVTFDEFVVMFVSQKTAGAAA